MMKSSDIFPESNRLWVQPQSTIAPTAQFVQTVCCMCKTPISLKRDWQINGLAACGLCMYDYEITKTTLPCPYKVPRSRKLIERKRQYMMNPVITAQATCGYTSTEQLARFLQDPMGGL